MNSEFSNCTYFQPNLVCPYLPALHGHILNMLFNHIRSISSLDTISIELVFFPLIWLCVWHSWNALWGLTVSHLSPRYSTLAQRELEMPLPAPVIPHLLAWPPLCLQCPEPGQLWQPGHRFFLPLPDLDAVQTHGVWNLASPRTKYKRVSL